MPVYQGQPQGLGRFRLKGTGHYLDLQSQGLGPKRYRAADFPNPKMVMVLPLIRSRAPAPM